MPAFDKGGRLDQRDQKNIPMILQSDIELKR